MDFILEFKKTYLNKNVWSTKNLDGIPAGDYCVYDIQLTSGGIPGDRLYYRVEMYDLHNPRNHFRAEIPEEFLDIWEQTFRIYRK